jgi:hypothetical protein
MPFESCLAKVCNEFGNNDTHIQLLVNTGLSHGDGVLCKRVANAYNLARLKAKPKSEIQHVAIPQV